MTTSFPAITAAELDSGRFELTYLIDGVLVKDQPAGLVAPKKSLKTSIAIDLAVSLAKCGRFLGYFRVAEPKRVALCSGESGMATIQETSRRICSAAGVSLRDTGIFFSDTVPRFGDAEHLDSFREFLQREGIEVVVIDPVYLCLPYDVNPANLFDIGRMLRNVNEVCQQAGATPVLVHHLKKTIADPYAPGQLEDIGWAGFQEFFRQWMLLNRREKYVPGSGVHRLWFSTGGSAGHSLLVGLDVFEGAYDPQAPQPRSWSARVLKPKDVIDNERRRIEEEKEKQAESKAMMKVDAARRRMAVALHERPDGDTLTGLSELAGLSRARAKEGIEVLIEKGVAVTCKVTKGNNKRVIDGYRLARYVDDEVDSDDPDKMTRTNESDSVAG